jgi:glyoxylase-like metal-dependent hydrolase (beta-lactamase superfamily II)
MKKAALALFLLLCPVLPAQTRVVGPYTLHPIIPGVTRIEDANRSNPAGIHLGADDKPTGFNNCSDMYLVVGGDKALLIDLSNFITWDATAVTSLQAIVRQEIGTRKLFVTVTHNHSDHLGMLPAFKDHRNVTFWIQTAEFEGRNLFPADRTIPIATSPTLDLGNGFVVNALEVPGHTDHSTVFFLKGKNLLFSGDGIGSGGGVWLFSAAGFAKFRHGVDRLIAYIRTPANGIDESKLVILGGHYWQKRGEPKLTMQYILDMRTLIGEIKAGRAREEKVSFGKYLDTDFIYGEAIITWNKADAEEFRAE